MTGTCCSVPGCHLRGGHEFPIDKERRKSWINAIKRLDQTTELSMRDGETCTNFHLKLSFIHHHIYINLCTSKKKHTY